MNKAKPESEEKDSSEEKASSDDKDQVSPASSQGAKKKKAVIAKRDSTAKFVEEKVQTKKPAK